MENKNITLANIAGYEDEKKEAKKMINIIKNIDTFEKYGATLPKGMLLAGRPGVGKTLFVNAIANESGAPTYVFDASDDANKATNLKKIFKDAKEHKPSIIVIEEIDYLVPRSSFESDSCRTLFKTLLTEIDGISNSSGVFVLATSNSEDFPRSLTRSGRLEKTIVFDRPKKEDRQAILKLYCKNNDLFNQVELENVAADCTDMVGADLKNLVNQAVINAISEGKDKVTEEEMVSLIPQIRFKTIKKTEDNDKNKERVSCHEIGHLLCSYALTKSVSNVSIEIYNHIRGFCTESEEVSFDTVSKMKNDLVIAMGGMAGELVGTGERSLGTSGDMKDAFSLCRSILASGEYGFFCIPNDVLSEDIYPSAKSSDKKEAMADEIVAKLMEDAFNSAYELILNCKSFFMDLVSLLAKNNTLSSSQIKEFFRSRNITPEMIQGDHLVTSSIAKPELLVDRS